MSDDIGPAVILITGVMAAGKTTVARLLAERLPRAAYVPGDAFRRMLVSGREDPLPEMTSEARAQLDLRHRLSALVADEYATAGWTTIVQDILLGDDLSRYVARVRTRPLYLIVLAPSPEAVRSRESSRPKTGYGPWTITTLDQTLRERTPRLGLWLDTSTQTPTETATTILNNLPTARLDL